MSGKKTPGESGHTHGTHGTRGRTKAPVRNGPPQKSILQSKSKFVLCGVWEDKKACEVLIRARREMGTFVKSLFSSQSAPGRGGAVDGIAGKKV